MAPRAISPRSPGMSASSLRSNRNAALHWAARRAAEAGIPERIATEVLRAFLAAKSAESRERASARAGAPSGRRTPAEDLVLERVGLAYRSASGRLRPTSPSATSCSAAAPGRRRSHPRWSAPLPLAERPVPAGRDQLAKTAAEIDGGDATHGA